MAGLFQYSCPTPPARCAGAPPCSGPRVRRSPVGGGTVRSPGPALAAAAAAAGSAAAAGRGAVDAGWRAACRRCCCCCQGGARCGSRASTGASTRRLIGRAGARGRRAWRAPTGGRSVVYVSNHSSWLDIPVLGGGLQACFVSKDDVAGWPVIGTDRPARPHGLRQPPRAPAPGASATTCCAGWPRATTRCCSPRAPARTARACCRSAPSFFAIAERRPGRRSIQPVSVVYDRLAGLPAGPRQPAGVRLVRRHGARPAFLAAAQWRGLRAHGAAARAARPARFSVPQGAGAGDVAGGGRRGRAPCGRTARRSRRARGSGAGGGRPRRSARRVLLDRQQALVTPGLARADTQRSSRALRLTRRLGRPLLRPSPGRPGRRSADVSRLTRRPATTGRKRLHVITWGCQMNVYDSGRMADVLAPLGYAPADRARRRRHGDPQHLPHPRQGGREGVLRTRPPAPAEGGARGAGRRMILAVAGCVAQAEGAEILARAPYVDIVLGPQTYHRLPEMVARAAPRRRRGDRHRFPGRGQVRPPARQRRAAGRHRVPDHPGRLRQVLQLLRRALHARRRAEPPGRRRPGRGAAPGRAGRARDHPARAERQRLARRRRRTAAPGASAGCCARWRRSPACCGCATPPRIRATWTTT